MRVVGGTFRGKPLEAPRGRDTRPTTDRIRESIASMILSAQGLDLSECDVLDAFAGSGAMGIELLSRGARSCVFCERDRRAANVVRANCASVGLSRGAYRVICADSLRLASSATSTEALAALEVARKAADDLSHNVSPQLTLEVMLLGIKEAFSCQPSSR